MTKDSTPRGSKAPHILDTRPIFEAGGSPCGAIDDAVKLLKRGQSLVLLVPFEPVPLYTKLGHAGFEAHPEELANGTWRVEFRPVGDAIAGPVELPRCGCSGPL